MFCCSESAASAIGGSTAIYTVPPLQRRSTALPVQYYTEKVLFGSDISYIYIFIYFLQKVGSYVGTCENVCVLKLIILIIKTTTAISVSSKFTIMLKSSLNVLVVCGCVFLKIASMEAGNCCHTLLG